MASQQRPGVMQFSDLLAPPTRLADEDYDLVSEYSCSTFRLPSPRLGWRKRRGRLRGFRACGMGSRFCRCISRISWMRMLRAKTASGRKRGQPRHPRTTGRGPPRPATVAAHGLTDPAAAPSSDDATTPSDEGSDNATPNCCCSLRCCCLNGCLPALAAVAALWEAAWVALSLRKFGCCHTCGGRVSALDETREAFERRREGHRHVAGEPEMETAPLSE